MGLDMYLSKKTYVKNWDHNPPEKKVVVTVQKGEKGLPHPDIQPARVSYIIEEVAYWRKANAIHKWFVDNVQAGVDECRESNVEKKQLTELVGLCEQVLKAKGKAQKKLAEKLLPPQAGFFFGSTAIDDWYLADLKATVEMLKPELDEKDESFYVDYIYRASW